jgi:hypothetical protein
MSLNEMPKGKIIMFAGGTGLHPYCDLIDLVYKEMLVSQNSQFSSKIIKNDPLIDKKPFSTRFRFVLYLSVQSTNDIHDITAYQLQ